MTIALVPLAALAALLSGPAAAMSALAGGFVVLVAQTYFVSRAFRHAGATSAREIVREFFRGEAGKFVLTVLLLAAVMTGLPTVQPGWLLTGFVLEQLVAVLALARTPGAKR